MEKEQILVAKSLESVFRNRLLGLALWDRVTQMVYLLEWGFEQERMFQKFVQVYFFQSAVLVLPTVERYCLVFSQNRLPAEFVLFPDVLGILSGSWWGF